MKLKNYVKLCGIGVDHEGSTLNKIKEIETEKTGNKNDSQTNASTESQVPAI